MHLNRADRTKMAKDNYRKNREMLKEQRKNKSEPPITNSQKRAGSGKGDANRIIDMGKWKKNYDRINWLSKNTKLIKGKSVKELIKGGNNGSSK